MTTQNVFPGRRGLLPPPELLEGNARVVERVAVVLVLSQRLLELGQVKKQEL